MQNKKNIIPLQSIFKGGAIAQLVEQRTENPCVPGSNPGGATLTSGFQNGSRFFYFLITLVW